MRFVSIAAPSLLALGLGAAFFSACSSSSSGTTTPVTLKCASPGQATPGNADTHCNGVPTQPVSQASCGINDAGFTGGSGDDAGDDAGADDCPYGPTMFGNEADDDDCKYHVVWSTTDLCEGEPGVTFSATITNKSDGSPVTNMPDGIDMEVFIPTDLKATCDNASTHASPDPSTLIESPSGSGTYKGRVVFDASGEWTVRFHIHEECSDTLPDSPHGHAAFHVTLP